MNPNLEKLADAIQAADWQEVLALSAKLIMTWPVSTGAVADLSILTSIYQTALFMVEMGRVDPAPSPTHGRSHR